MACMAVSSSRMVKGKQQNSAAVCSCSAFFRWRDREHSVFLNDGQFTAAYCCTMSLVFLEFIRLERLLWNPGSQNAVEWEEALGDLIRFQALAGSGLPSRTARNSSHSVLRASSESRLTSSHAARYFSRLEFAIRGWGLPTV